MKKLFKGLLCSLMAGVMLFGVVGCDLGGDSAPSGSFTYDDGISTSGNYDSTYFYKNDRSVLYASDPGMIYITDEMDPTGEYAGWYYLYATSRKGNGSLLGYKTKDFATYYNLGPVWKFTNDGWGDGDKWAPEVIYNPNDGLYYFYMNCGTKNKPTAAPSWAAYPGGYTYDDMYISVAVADNPEGPFIEYERVHEGESNVYGEVYAVDTPPMKFENHFDEMTNTDPAYGGGLSIGDTKTGYYTLDTKARNYAFSIIDVSPFYDEKTIKTDASGNPVIGVDGDYEYYYPLYLTFNKHFDSYTGTSSLWIVEMFDPATPNYYTVSPLTFPTYGAWTKDANNVFVRDEYKYGTDYVPAYDSGVNEGNYLQYHYTTDPVTGERTKHYYLTYANPGFGSKLYSTDVAVSTEVLGIGAPGRTFQQDNLAPYEKIAKIVGAPMNGVESNWENASGAAHHAIVEISDEEMYIAYHVWTDVAGADGGGVRSIAVDRLHWRYNETLGYDVYHSNGPTTSLQPIPTTASGMSNIATKATITAAEGEKDRSKDAKILIDKYVPIHAYSDSDVFRASGKTTFTLEWLEPYTINSLFVYNSYQYEEAFKKLDAVRFYLEDGTIYEAKDITFNPEYLNTDSSFVQPGAAAVMGFDEISVTKIEIEVSKAVYSNAKRFGVGEIYVMGRRTY